jgi:hypothetical protein
MSLPFKSNKHSFQNQQSMKPFFILIPFFLSVTACVNFDEKQSEDPSPTKDSKVSQTVWQEPALPLVASLEKAHRVEAFRQKKALAFDLQLRFGGQDRLKARISTTTGSDRIRVDREDGTTLFYYRGEGYKMPPDSSWPGARFDLLTWPYFAMAPFKLSDPGTHWEALPEATEGEKSYARGKLTFVDGVGDAPDDWYVAYQDVETGLLEGLAYIVTFSRTQAEAEKNPHAIRYSDYVQVEGIPIASHWTFWNWSEEKGFEGPMIGEARLTNIQFTDPKADFFRPHEKAVPIPKEQM